MIQVLFSSMWSYIKRNGVPEESVFAWSKQAETFIRVHTCTTGNSVSAMSGILPLPKSWQIQDNTGMRRERLMASVVHANASMYVEDAGPFRCMNVAI